MRDSHFSSAWCGVGRIVGIVAGLLLSACRGASSPAMPTLLPSNDLPVVVTEPFVPTPTPLPDSFYIQPGVPQSLVERLLPILSEAGLVETSSPETAVIRVVLDPGPEAVLRAQWVYAVAAPFPTIPDDISWADLRRYWQGDTAALAALGNLQLVVAPDVASLLIAKLGNVAGETPLMIAETEQLSEMIWAARPAIGILPFDQLEPRLKALTLDGQSVLDRALQVETYPLTVQIGLVAQGEGGNRVATMIEQSGAWLSTNRETSRMTVVVLTGTTALARATAMEMEINGLDFPARNILPFLADADILHTSNESSFTPACPPPQWEGEPKFCSQPRYFSLLQTIGLDVIELTGNHNNDWGTDAALYSLGLYEQNGLVYYGGGRDLADALTPRILSAPDGTRIAFVGCNSAGPYTAWATEYSAGAAPCGDWSSIRQTITALKTGGLADVVIATLQYQELPQYNPSQQQIADFEALVAAGADIVSGSQAHQPQGFGLPDGGFIHYGVGNLFFDQMDYIENRQMFADKYILYEGRLLSVVLFTGMMEDYSQPRPMTAEERSAFLELIFQASGW